MDLTEFLLARISEDEAGAGAWRVGEHYGIHVYEEDRPVATFRFEADARRCVYTMSRLFAECDAKREVVNFYRAVPDGMQQPYRAGLARALRCLALPYADHPDYSEEWRP